MQNSVLQTMAIPAIGLSDPSRLVQAGKIPLRVLIRNVGANNVLLAHDVPDVAQIGSQGATYQLPPGQADVIVLAPGQSVIAASVGGGGMVSIAYSEAIPVGPAYLGS